MRILVVGAGAVGDYFGGRLAEANRDVKFLVRARRADEIKEKGLQIVSPHRAAAIEADRERLV
jgi:2-dehydropantoate 2-reductase